MANPYEVVADFERAVAEFTGAPHCIAVDSCTNALRLCFERAKRHEFVQKVGLPRYTYVGVPQAALAADLDIEWIIDNGWEGEYSIPRPRHWIVDAAKWFRKDMHRMGNWTCVSFQAYKQLPIGRGGAILCDSERDAEWFRKARFDGRDMSVSLYDQKVFQWGMHCPMPPDAAARGLWLMQNVKPDAGPIGSWKDYPDLSTKEWL